ncbi:unnamed protein product [Heterotrigona itama]|uniref:peptidylprolyl isomerase n=1 Tax=Heterotrigona itama TaxID=395501 RepID=A0A6V7H010_9HYME|nr:unnamed protein product [Heterotrigona itama]
MLLQTWKSADNIVRKDIINPGTFCKKPTECATCEVIIENINVTNASVHDLESKFNSEILNNRSKNTLTIGEANCEIDRQIERAIQMMMVSEKSLVTVDVLLEGIDNSLVIKFEITLNDVQPYKPIWEWTPEEKYSVALKYKEAGVGLFKEGRYVDAFHRFSKACKILITLEPIKDLELDKTLEKSNNVKALYRRGVAHGNLKDVEKAVADLKNAANLEPHNQTIKEQLSIYNVKLQEANQKFENMMRRMFKT